MEPARKRIAIVGTGVSGIACSWALRGSAHHVDLYDGDDRMGGHANSVPFTGNGYTYPVDTGFIALNSENYPNFCNFLDNLGVSTSPTDMSLSVSRDQGAFEWASTSLRGFVSQTSNLLKPSFWRMAFDVVRFNYFATDLLVQLDKGHGDVKPFSKALASPSELESIGAYLDREGYSAHFKKDYLIPMVAAPWCIEPDEFSTNFPASTLIRFMWNHRLLDTVSETLQWSTVQGGSKSYVDAFANTMPLNHHVHLETPIESVSRTDDGKMSLVTCSGQTEIYDHVILAVHANQALKILGEGAKEIEKDILQHFHTRKNVCVLHSDESLMPNRPTTYAAWNCLMRSSAGPQVLPEEHDKQISLTFDMNKLQQIPMPGEDYSPGRVLISMNPIHEPEPATVQSSHVYYHPLLSSASVSATSRLGSINGVDRVSFAGAWMGHGFHEDGFTAGLRAANSILLDSGDQIKWSDGSHVRGDRPAWSRMDTIYRSAIETVQAQIEYWTSNTAFNKQPSYTLPLDVGRSGVTSLAFDGGALAYGYLSGSSKAKNKCLKSN
ncbi:MAG: hypothetical protein M1828_004844 [Chrysothrix sp. TS-e1954]|nr:MAG: hypothetical protein M1828_004844 [Chrysothrix sp. TS-e1954]